MGLLDRLMGRKAEPLKTRSVMEAAAGGRRWQNTPSVARIGPETLAASPRVRGRSRHAVHSNGWAANGVSALVAGLVGYGIKPASQHPDAATRATIAAAIATWARRADAEGRTDLYGIYASAVRALVMDGEAFIRLETRPEGLRLRLLPAEMIDESDTRDLPGGGYVVAGIEFNAAGQRVAYHVLKARPTEIFASSYGTFRVPAEDMIHLMHPLGAGQVRGISWLAPILLRLNELDQLEDALAVGVKTAAMFAGFLIDKSGTGDGMLDGVSYENGLLTRGLQPGAIEVVSGDYDLKFSTPQQAQQTAEFVSHQIRAIAAGLGVPAHLVSGDLRDASYGSLRAGMIAFRQKLEGWQFQTLIPQMCQPIWERAVSTLILRGDLHAPDFESAAPLYLAAEHYPPPMPWIDPLKDSQAIREAMESGLMSRRQAVASLGFDVELLDAEIAADREREARLGISFAPAGVRDAEET